VHGVALLEDNNPDVPTCIDCHGVHNIQNPTTTLFRVRSPELCAGCHADADLMAQYDISTHVFDSYLTDFHGSTVALFEQQAPDVATNKAVCYDCHGAHNIQAVDEDGEASIRETLLTTCQQCHPGANADFSDAWLGHYPATMKSHPGLFLVNRFYDVLTPLFIGGLALVVGSGLFRRFRRTRKSGG
jgi:predicted CXXCH cytochrome family protein